MSKNRQQGRKYRPKKDDRKQKSHHHEDKIDEELLKGLEEFEPIEVPDTLITDEQLSQSLIQTRLRN